MDDVSDPTSTSDRGFINSRSLGLAIYGTMAAGLALAIGADTGLANTAVIVAVLAELVGFFLIHVYADMLGEHISHPGTRIWKRFEHACLHDVLLLAGGIPVVVLFTLETVAGISTNLGADIALVLLIVLLGTFGAIAARRAYAAWPAALGEGLLAAVLGGLVLLLKLVLH
jgi:uncharacterized membrane protein SirB2